MRGSPDPLRCVCKAWEDEQPMTGMKSPNTEGEAGGRWPGDCAEQWPRMPGIARPNQEVYCTCGPKAGHGKQLNKKNGPLASGQNCLQLVHPVVLESFVLSSVAVITLILILVAILSPTSEYDTLLYSVAPH